MLATESRQRRELEFPVLLPKLSAILARGLCKGLGQRGGQMCIEGAGCEALGEAHGDRPSCVADDVRGYKVSLNDSDWSSTAARAAGLADLGIAQLGTEGFLEYREFTVVVQRHLIRTLVPALLRQVCLDPGCLAQADACERDPTPANLYAASRAINHPCPTIAEIRAGYTLTDLRGSDPCYLVNGAREAQRAEAYLSLHQTDKYLLIAAQAALDALTELGAPGALYLASLKN